MALLSGAVFLAAAGLLSLALRRSLVDDRSWPVRRLAEGILFVTIAILTGQLLGLVGHLSPPGFRVAGLLLILLAGPEIRHAMISARALLSESRSELHPSPAVLPHPGSSADEDAAGVKKYLLPAGMTLVVLAAWAHPVSEGIEFGIFRQDSLWYHLTFAARFAQEGEVGQLVYTDPLGVLPWYFPQNIELVHALGMVWLGNDFLSLLVNLFALSLALLAAWCLGSSVGKGFVTFLVAAFVLITPGLLSQAATAAVDLPVTALILVGVVFLFRGWDRCDAGRRPAKGGTDLLEAGPFIVSGLSFGLAAGSKLTALTPLVVVFLGIAFFAPRDRRLLWTSCWGLAAALSSGFWYLRNLVVSGNPLPWFDLALLEPVQRPEEYPRPAYSIAEYLEQPSIAVVALPPQLESALGPLWPFLLILVLAGLIVGLLAGKPVIARVVALSLALLVVAHIVFTPISASGVFPEPVGLAANLRYLAPVFVLGPIFLVRWLSDRAPDVVPFLTASLIVSTLFTLVSDPPSSGDYLPALLLVLLVLPSLAIVIARLRIPVMKKRVLLAGAAAVWLGFAISILRDYGDEVGERPRQSDALGMPGFVESTEWSLLEKWAEEIPASRIGAAGPAASYGQYSLVGRSLQHTVRQIGKERRDGRWGPARSCEEWRSQVNASDSDFLVIANEGFGLISLDSSPAFWTRTDESALEIGRGDFLSIFALNGRLNPETCQSLKSFKSESTPWGGESSLLRANLPAPGVNVLNPRGASINSGP